MIPKIPQELIDAIIDYLADPEDLSRCALVGRSWQSRAQSHIFHTVFLGVGIQGGFASGLVEIPPLGADFDNFRSFRKLVEGSPHLALRIRNLKLGLPPLQSEYPAQRSASWQIIEDSIVGCLPLLKGLDSLGLFPCGPSTHTFHLQPHILNAFRDLSLKSLHFSKWRFTDSSALSLFTANPPSSLRFIKCEFVNTPLLLLPFAPFGDDLTTLEFRRCEGLEVVAQHLIAQRYRRIHYMTIRIIYCPETALAVLQTLSHMLRSVGEALTIVFDKGKHSVYLLFYGLELIL
ncbi:hypothetical protein B0H13DRAFT_2390535 [Mycena leptocephala]|nr:hypothetical protein B0H13DRAFT_2390535 [Mycena leptocephala]